MGPKITIDSATLMNKGLEVIEARWLFDVDADRIDVVIHPQSIVHSMVEYIDGSVLAQMAVPDMTIPIGYALAYPNRLPLDYLRPLDLPAAGTLTFVAPDRPRFPVSTSRIARSAPAAPMPAVLNAANEIAVERFLAEDIAYREIPTLVASRHGRARACAGAAVSICCSPPTVGLATRLAAAAPRAREGRQRGADPRR